MSNYFEILNGVDVSKYIEKKNNLSYLSWANAWAELKKRMPDATYTVYENEHGWNYFTDGRTCWVKTGVTVTPRNVRVDDKGHIVEMGEPNPIEHIEYLPVMDYRNKSIPADQVTSFDVNKAIQRSLTKAVARHGLGLYIYAGEDLPEEPVYICADCGNVITAAEGFSAGRIAKETMSKHGKYVCMSCLKKAKANRDQLANNGDIPVEVH